jgi:hypothetical protein
VRLDHLLSKEHTPRTIYRVPALVGAAVWWALVVFTSGIIDERRRVVAAVSSTACLGFAWWVWNARGGLCMVGLAHCWALKNQAEGDVMSLVGLVFSWCLIT